MLSHFSYKVFVNLQLVLPEEVEIAVVALKKGKSAGVDNNWGDHDRCFDKDL